MPTVSDLIHSSMRLIGAIAAGETLETTELNDAFTSLNEMIDSWNTEGASLPGRQRLTIPLQQTNTYVLASRPNQIVAASSSIAGVDSAVEIVDAAGFEAVPEKGLLSIYVKKLYCDYMLPTASIYLWPTPRIAGNLEMFITSPMVLFGTLTDSVNLPAGYETALRFNLALALAPEYGRPIDQLVMAQAQNLKASIVQLNVQNQIRTPAQPPPPVIAAPMPT